MKCIAIMGAECSGKSTLAEALHKRLGGIMLKESLRLFCDKQGRTPFRHEQKALMLQAQQALNHNQCNSPYSFIWCDTSPLQTAIYSLIYFADPSLLKEALTLQAGFDLTLVCDINFAWQTDPWRDGIVRQRQCQHALLNILRAEQAKPIVWKMIQGNVVERIVCATQYIQGLS